MRIDRRSWRNYHGYLASKGQRPVASRLDRTAPCGWRHVSGRDGECRSSERIGKSNTYLFSADGNMHDLPKRTVSEARRWRLAPCVPKLRGGGPCANPTGVLVVRIRFTVFRRRRDHGHTEEQRGSKNQFPSQEAPLHRQAAPVTGTAGSVMCLATIICCKNVPSHLEGRSGSWTYSGSLSASCNVMSLKPRCLSSSRSRGSMTVSSTPMCNSITCLMSRPQIWFDTFCPTERDSDAPLK